MNIFGKYFDDNEKVLKSLTKIYGIGRVTATELGMSFGIGTTNKVKDLSKETWSRLIQAIELGPKKYTTVVKKPASYRKIENRDGNAEGRQRGIVENKSLSQILCETRAITAVREKIELEKKIKSYRGLRHVEGLPCRGQRTHTNAKTARKKG